MGDLHQLYDRHEQAQMLLPWHVNGTLEPGEAAIIEAHLAECEECREDFAANVALRRLYASMPLEHGPARPASLGAAGAGIGSRAASSARFLKRRIGSSWGRTATAAFAAAAAVALMLVIAPSQRNDDYRLLGSDSAEAPGNAIVLFSPDTAERDLRSALEAVGARLVDGPTASGAYVVHLPEDERSAGLEQLRELPHVILAEPVDASDGP